MQYWPHPFLEPGPNSFSAGTFQPIRAPIQRIIRRFGFQMNLDIPQSRSD